MTRFRAFTAAFGLLLFFDSNIHFVIVVTQVRADFGPIATDTHSEMELGTLRDSQAVCAMECISMKQTHLL